MTKLKKLSPREKEILFHIAWGQSEKEIGDNLGIAKNTVNNFKRKLFKKTGLNKDIELASFYQCYYNNALTDKDPFGRVAKAVSSFLLLVVAFNIFISNDTLIRRGRRGRRRQEIECLIID